MKNLMIYVLIVLAFVFTSCSSPDANADVEKLITNLNYFNQTFDELYEDGVISKEGDDSEYKKLREIANQYYEALNNINKKIKKEQAEAEEGQTIDGYEEAFEAAKKEKQSEIEKATQQFMENLEKIEPAEKIEILEETETMTEELEETSDVTEEKGISEPSEIIEE
jgi:Skp family chaperone for outer membrane proteins